MPTIPEALAVAIERHQGGRLAEAEQIYRQILQADPNQADALHLLGLIAHRVGKADLAVEYIQRAIALKGYAPEFHHNLASVYYAQRRAPKAVASYRRALELNPNLAVTHTDLGVALKNQGEVEEAVACHRRALALDPALASAHRNLGVALRDLGQLDEAAACCRRALEIDPSLAEVHSNLSLILKDQGKLEEAVAACHRALAINPELAEAHNNLGYVLGSRGNLEEVIAAYRRALALKPDFAEAHNNLGLALLDQGKPEEAVAALCRARELEPGLTEAEAHNSVGNALMEQGKLDQAIDFYRRALALSPGLADAHNNLGLAFKDAARLDEAIASFRRGLACQPVQPAIQSNLLYTLHFHPALDAARICEEHRRWSQQFAEPLRALRRPHPHDRDPERTLRIGYVSSDFCEHVVGRNVLPVFRNHDRARFEVCGYSGVAEPDGLTRQFQELARGWRETAALSDEAVAEHIRADRIDLLIDLTLHTAGHRLLVFARKPAPVQVSWAGYPGSTGLDAIDYRLTDPWLDPLEAPNEYAPEEPIRLESFWCYDPLAETPAVSPLPALANGLVTFGSLNNYGKVNGSVLALWSCVLGAVNGSRLLLLSKEGAHREQALREFRRHGIAPERIEWLTPATRYHYLAAYHRIDLGLDTFPYNGHTTSLDSAWMGVPVITLAGKTRVGRGGLSQAMNLGLPELIAATPEQYIEIASDLAKDLPRLSRLRASLRSRLQASPIMDAPRFTRKLEIAYREAWRRWCAR